MTPDEMKALIDSVAHDIVEHRWPHIDDELFEELRQTHLDLAEKIVTEVLATLPAHPAEVRRLRALSAHPVEETEWEVAGIPICADGEEWMQRPIEACEALVAEYADPTHWVHEPHNDDLYPVVGFRLVRRRKAGPWLQVPEGSET